MLGSRIDKSGLAIGVTRRRKFKTYGQSRTHLTWLKTLPCVLCGVEMCGDAHHLKKGVDNLPKGMGRTHLDRYGLPVCRIDHDYLEDGDDEAKLTAKGLDGRAIVDALWRDSGDTAAGMRIIHRHRAAAGLV